VSGVELAAVAVCGLPLGAAVANGLNALTGDRLYGHVAVARVAVTAVLASFVASLFIAVTMAARPATREVTVYRFIESGDFSVDFGFLLDPLSVVMMLVVTGISVLVTHFSVNYMHNEAGFTRYFTVVSLFVFAMLVLVMADSYLVMFLGWEGVGVCSYLLISFYRDRPASAQAGTKAFVMNRVGDAGLLIGMFVLAAHTGGVRYSEVFAQASALPRDVVEAVGLLFLLGATGKSAQLPLGTWLARAMEGPTPSSALMHAATMVTAGVYLVARSAPIYDQAPRALIAVGIVGALTALYGQLMGYVQTDIKGLLAASTTAQLGFMFLFCGLGLYAVAIFHLVAHAFYKTYLFLTAPSILHHLHGGADPTAASRPSDTARPLAAIILAAAVGLIVAPLIGRVPQQAGGGLPDNAWVVLALALVAIFATAFSALRITAVAFAGHAGHDDEPVSGVGRGADRHPPRPADRPRRLPTARLVAPLGVLAGLVALGIAVGVLPGGLEGSWFQRMLDQIPGGGVGAPPGNSILAAVFTATIVLLLLSGWYGPRYLDRFRDELPAGDSPGPVRGLYWWALNRGYLDENFDRAIVGPTTAVGRALERFDKAVLDRPPPPGASAAALAAHHTETWEERFLALSAEHAAGTTALAEPPERLDWLWAGDAAPDGSRPDHPHAGAARVAVATRRAVAWSRSAPDGGGAFGAAADATGRLTERIERVVFQPADTGALKLAGIIAGVIDAVERTVFQTGVERGLARSGAVAQRLLLAIEQRLAQPQVIGSILALALLALIVGTR
jgi:NADH-quinone oxidoreductase subunit L